MELLSINGDPPRLEGLRCDEILCQEYWHGGVLIEPANVTFLCFEGRWHRLYFDLGIVFWRVAEGSPAPFEAPEMDSVYRIVDVATEHGFRGLWLRGYRMEPWGDAGARVTFEFENGGRLTFQSVDDITTYDEL